MVAASIPATTMPRNPFGRIRASMAGMAYSESWPGPMSASAAMPHSMGIMPRPRKMTPVHVKTCLPTSVSRVEKVRMAVVCQQVFNAIQKLAVAKQYDFILDKSEGITVIFADPKLDKSEDVLRYMGVK